MTKKDYELIGHVLQNAKIQPTMDKKAFAYLVKEFSRWLWINNPRFDFKKFYQSVGLEAPEAITFD